MLQSVALFLGIQNPRQRGKWLNEISWQNQLSQILIFQKKPFVSVEKRSAV